MKFDKPAALNRTFDVHVVGCGGTGSVLATHLARMSVALDALRMPSFHLHLWDPDAVSTANVGRQMFSESDVGKNKAALLATRLMCFFDVTCIAHTERFSSPSYLTLVVGCVDTPASRRVIGKSNYSLWLDCGNSARTGQVVLGHQGFNINRRKYLTLPNVLDLFPALRDPAQDAADPGPSCSLADALQHQDLFINSMVAGAAADLLWQLLRHGSITHHGAFIGAGRITPLPICKDTWRRLIGRPPRTPRPALRKRRSRRRVA